MIEEKTRVPNSAVPKRFGPKTLLKTRRQHGFDSPIGYRCSNVIEMRQNKVSKPLIDKQLDELRQLLAVQGN